MDDKKLIARAKDIYDECKVALDNYEWDADTEYMTNKLKHILSADKLTEKDRQYLMMII